MKTQPSKFERADPAALAAFDPKTKICVMNCGRSTGDPRSRIELKLLCDDCLDAPPQVLVKPPCQTCNASHANTPERITRCGTCVMQQRGMPTNWREE